MLIKNKDDNGAVLKDENGKEAKHLSFGVGSVFDVSQVEGNKQQELREFRSFSYSDLLETIKGYYNIEFKNLPLNKGGYINEAGIVINALNNTEKQYRTLLHEFAHGILGHLGDSKDREIKEIEAESVTFVLTEILGIDNNSDIYIKSWKGDGKRIRKSVVSIEKVVNKILDIFSNQ